MNENILQQTAYFSYEISVDGFDFDITIELSHSYYEPHNQYF
jgi:hypothetical protein